MNQDDSQHEVADLSLRIKSARKPEEHGTARKFVKGMLKLAFALLVVALVIAGIAGGIGGIGGIVYLRQEANSL